MPDNRRRNNKNSNLLGSTVPTNSESIDRNLQSFRFGLRFANAEIVQFREREGISRFYIDEIVDEALGEGFEIVDADDNPIPSLDQWTSFFEETKFLEHFSKAIKDARAFGQTGLLHYASGEVKSFPPYPLNNLIIKADIVDQKPTIIGADLREEYNIAVNNSKYTTLSVGSGTDYPIEDVFNLVILDEGKLTFEGMPVLSPIWDLIAGLYILKFMTVIHVARVAGGLKIVYTPETDEAEKDRIINDMTQLNYKLSMVLGPEDRFEVYQGEGQGVDVSKVEDLLINALASSTGIPSTRWKGVLPGQIEGAQLNKESYMDVLKKIQKQATYWLKDSLKKISKLTGLPLPDLFKIDWSYKQQPSEKEKADLLKVLSDSITNLGDVLTGNEIREILEFEPLDFFNGENEKTPLNFISKQSSFNITMPPGQGQDPNQLGQPAPNQPPADQTNPNQNATQASSTG